MAPPGGVVPVTAKLSQKLYDKLGEDVTNELVDWFNAVDTTYRADLRELNETNFQRFDAKLGERLAELDGKWGVRWTEVDAKVERRLAELRDGLRAEVSLVRKEMSQLETKLADRLGQVKSDLLKWML